MYNKSYKTGPGEPHVNNETKKPTRSINNQVKKGKTLYGREMRLNREEYGLSAAAAYANMIKIQNANLAQVAKDQAATAAKDLEAVMAAEKAAAAAAAAKDLKAPAWSAPAPQWFGGLSAAAAYANQINIQNANLAQVAKDQAATAAATAAKDLEVATAAKDLEAARLATETATAAKDLEVATAAKDLEAEGWFEGMAEDGDDDEEPAGGDGDWEPAGGDNTQAPGGGENTYTQAPGGDSSNVTSQCPPCNTNLSTNTLNTGGTVVNFESSNLFDLVSFLEQPNQSIAPVIFGDPNYNASDPDANDNLSFSKSLFRTQVMGCGVGEGLDFPDIHATIISNQYKTYGQMKFFGHTVLAWNPITPSATLNKMEPRLSKMEGDEELCNHGEHTITATSDQVSSIKIRYVRRFFYVYYGLVIKEIGSLKISLLAEAMKYRARVLSRQAAILEGAGAESVIIHNLDASIADSARYGDVATTFFVGAVPYHISNLRSLNTMLINLGGGGVDEKLFALIGMQYSLYEEQVNKQGEHMELLAAAAGLAAANAGEAEQWAEAEQNATLQLQDQYGMELGEGDNSLSQWVNMAPPSDLATEHFKTLAKAVISTLIGDQAPPQLFYEMVLGPNYTSALGIMGARFDFEWNQGTKWSVIIQAFMNAWDADAAEGGDQRTTTWIKNQIMSWGGYILRHLTDEEEWIISRMGALLNEGKYSNSEGVIMASQFLTILGKSVGLTRAQAVQDVQEASGIVTELEGNTAALNLQIQSLMAQITALETESSGAELERMEAAGAAGAANNTLQNISTSWANFMTSIGGDIPYPTSLHNAPISSEIDYVKTKLVEKHDDMEGRISLLDTMEVDLSAARANLVAAQANVTRIDADLVTANADLDIANADLVTANASVGSSNIIITDLIDNPNCSVAEGNVRDLLSGQITALEGTIERQVEVLATRLAKINELEAAETGAVTAEAKLAAETDIYKDKLKKAKETSEADIKLRNMIIIGLAVFIIILIIVVIMK